MILGMFCVVNEHFLTEIVACSLQVDETKDSFEWIYCKILEFTKSKPKVLFTDADIAMDAAISSMLPETLHFWCSWHLNVNLTSNLSGLLQPDFNEFLKAFNSCRNSIDETTFNSKWNEILKKYPKATPYLKNYIGMYTSR